MVSWVASAIHSTANPRTGTPNSTAKTFIPSASSSGTANAAFAPSRPAAVMPCPRGPSTIHRVGTLVVPDVPYSASLLQIIAMMISAATSDSPNIA